MRASEKMKNSKNANPKLNIGLKSILKKREKHNPRRRGSVSSNSGSENEDDFIISFDDLQDAESNHIFKSAQDLEFHEEETYSADSRREKKVARHLATPETQAQVTTERSRSRNKKTKNVMEIPLDFDEILQCSSIKTKETKELMGLDTIMA